METVFTKTEFDDCEKVRGIVLTKNYTDYDYYAVYIPKLDSVELYFQNPFDEKYYNIKDMKTVLGDKINSNHDIYMDLVHQEFEDCKSFIERIEHNDS